MSEKVVEQSDLGDLAKAIHNNDPLTADNISDLEDFIRHETWELWHTILFIYLYYFLIFVAFVECVLSLLFDLNTPPKAIGKFLGVCLGITLSWKLPSRLWIKLWKFCLYAPRRYVEKLFGEIRTPLDYAKESLQKLNGVEIRNIVEQPESEVLEFKSSVWAQYNNNSGELIDKQKSKSLALEDSIIKTIAAFLNTQGGKLIIGVQDRPKRKVVGIEADFQYSGKSKDVESFQNSLTNAIKTATNDPVIVGTYVEISIEIVDGKSICVIDVKQKAPKSWTYVNMKNWKNKGEKKECFFVRSGPSSNIIESRQSADEWKSARIEMQEHEVN